MITPKEALRISKWVVLAMLRRLWWLPEDEAMSAAHEGLARALASYDGRVPLAAHIRMRVRYAVLDAARASARWYRTNRPSRSEVGTRRLEARDLPEIDDPDDLAEPELAADPLPLDDTPDCARLMQDAERLVGADMLQVLLDERPLRKLAPHYNMHAATLCRRLQAARATLRAAWTPRGDRQVAT